jgi:hypothetical protein
MTVALDRPYCTIAEVQRFLALKSDDPALASKQDVIAEEINRASRTIDSLTRKRFYKTTYTDHFIDFQGDGAGVFALRSPVLNRQYGYIETPYCPIIKVTSIVEYLSMDAQLSPQLGLPTTLVENVDYKIDYQNGYIYRLIYTWNRSPNAIKITCDLGYDSADAQTPSATIPGVISRACRKLAASGTGMMRRDVFSTWTGAKQTLTVGDDDEKLTKQLQFMALQRSIE